MTLHHSVMRAARVLVAALLLTSAFSATAYAQRPSFEGSAVADPAPISGTTSKISQGGFVRFDVSWKNTSSSNLPQVSLKALTAAGATLQGLIGVPALDGVPYATNPCTTAGDLLCTFGAVRSQSQVTLSAVYKVPSSGQTFSQVFTFLAQGASPNDKGHNSRGDDMAVTGTVSLVSGSSNDAASFVFGTNDLVQNNQTLNRRNNPQSAKLDFSDSSLGAGFGAALTELASGACPTGITTCYGDLVIMKVNKGNVVGGGFLVTLGYTSVPGSATGHFVHWTTDDTAGAFETISVDCADAAAGQNCIEDSFKTGSNNFFVLHMFENGPMRGI
jgi:hypothetical protein